MHSLAGLCLEGSCLQVGQDEEWRGLQNNYSWKETFHTPRPQANHEEGKAHDFEMRRGGNKTCLLWLEQ
jgi:hypothetical protein